MGHQLSLTIKLESKQPPLLLVLKQSAPDTQAAAGLWVRFPTFAFGAQCSNTRGQS